MEEEPENIYWADQIAEKVIKERGKKEHYIIASGITPSGIVHIGNLREEMTCNIVKRALEGKGVKVKHIHSWDNYDRFRKVPVGIPQELSKYIGLPDSKVPDPWNCHKSYAEHFESDFSQSAKLINLIPEYIDETKEYTSCVYKELIKEALIKKEQVITALNTFKTEEIGEHWYPVEVYCEKCGKDSTTVKNYDGNYVLDYECTCGFSGQVDFSKKGLVKLKWRIDWPMRWKFFGVDFEPGGKDHSTPGGSRDTAKIISKEVYSYESPIYQMYDFVIVKGAGGKMSSSKGTGIALPVLLKVYLPEIVRFHYAGNRPKTEFAVSIEDDGVFKTYEDFYFAERVYFGKEKGIDKKKETHLKRVYEMSVVEKPTKKMPVQIPFKYIVILSQFYGNDNKIIDKMIESEHITKTQKNDPRIKQLIACARNWVSEYAPDDYIYEVQTEKKGDVTPDEKGALKILYETLNKEFNEDDLYNIGKTSGLCGNFFKLCYRILLNKERGPRLLELIDIIGKEKVKEIISKYM